MKLGDKARVITDGAAFPNGSIVTLQAKYFTLSGVELDSWWVTMTGKPVRAIASVHLKLLTPKDQLDILEDEIKKLETK